MRKGGGARKEGGEGGGKAKNGGNYGMGRYVCLVLCSKVALPGMEEE